MRQRATQKQKALDIFSTLCPNHLKSDEFSDKFLVVRLGMIYIHEVLTQMMCFLPNLHVFSKDLRCNTFSQVKSCFEIRKAGCYFVQSRTYNRKSSREVSPLLRTARQHTNISKYFALQKPNFKLFKNTSNYSIKTLPEFEEYYLFAQGDLNILWSWNIFGLVPLSLGRALQI